MANISPTTEFNTDLLEKLDYSQVTYYNYNKKNDPRNWSKPKKKL